MDRNVHSVLENIDQIRGTKGIVRNQWNLVAMGNVCHFLNIRNVDEGVTQGFNQDQLGVVLNGCFHLI